MAKLKILTNIEKQMFSKAISYFYKPFLIFTFLHIFPQGLLASIVSSDNFQTHQRIVFLVPKDKLNVRRTAEIIEVSTYDLEVFRALQEDLKQIEGQKKFIKSISFDSNRYPENPAIAKIELMGPEIEMFSFYRAPEQKLIIDVWANNETSASKSIKLNPIQELSQELDSRKQIPDINVSSGENQETSKVVNSNTPSKNSIVKKPISDMGEVKIQEFKTVAPDPKVEKKVEIPYRDFRYGGAHIWNYEGLYDRPGDLIRSQAKTIEYFYPIKDRKEISDEKEAQIQLSINLYRKEKFGLMEKSIKLYEQKYGKDSNSLLNDLLRANALQKTYIENGDANLRKTVLHLYGEILDKSKEYELQKAIIKFLMQTALEDKAHMELLRLSKLLFVKGRADFDTETATEAARYIVYALTQLQQLDKIQKFVEDDIVKKMLPGQFSLSAKSYVALSTAREKDLLSEYEKISSGLQRPLDASYLFNIAEAYFRTADYVKSLEHFTSFINTYNHLTQSSHARLRLALINDLLDKPSDRVIDLYKEAINGATDPKIRYEAKLRFVGYAFDRLMDKSKLEKELLVFLEANEIEKKNVDDDLSKLLWLVRLRSLINQGKYTEAFTYYKTIPLETFSIDLKRVFLAEAGEIIYGMMAKDFKEAHYTRVVKVWELYKADYMDRMAQDPYSNFMAGVSYLKLGLLESYDRVIRDYKTVAKTQQRTFPIWVERDPNVNQEQLVMEMEIARDVHLKNWDSVISSLESVSKEKFPKKDLYLGKAYVAKNNLLKAKESYERFFLEKTPDLILSDEETTTLSKQYVESLYELGTWERFGPVAIALSSELGKRSGNSSLIGSTKERIDYLYSEYVSSNFKLQNGLDPEKTFKQFLENFPKSSYKGRIQYLLGHFLLGNSKFDQAEDILNKIVGDSEVSNYIKELAKTDLSDLKIRRKDL